jgi:predicted kinase
MEAVIFTGIQASGKSTFFKEHFFNTHVRINLDMLRTRHREALLLRACLAAKQRFVVDNTNPTRLDRAGYIAQAKAEGFRVVSYYFEVDAPGSIARNAQRVGKARVPSIAIHGTRRRLEPPTPEEGFDEIYVVRIMPSGGFDVTQLHTQQEPDESGESHP